MAVASLRRTLKYANREFVLEAVMEDGQRLAHASAANGRADREFVLAAVKQNGLSLQHAVPELRADHEIIREAVMQNGNACLFLEERLQR